MAVISIIVLILLFGASINVSFIITYNFLLHFSNVTMPNFIKTIYNFLMQEIYVITPTINNFLTNENNFYYAQGFYFFILLSFIIFFSVILYKKLKLIYFIGYFFKFLLLMFLIINVFIGYVFTIINISIIFLMLFIYTFIIKNKNPKHLIVVKNIENNKGRSKISRFEKELNKLPEQIKITDQNDINKYYAKIGIIDDNNIKRIVSISDDNNKENKRYLHISNEIKNFNKKINTSNNIIDDSTKKNQRDEIMKKANLSKLKKLENEIFELNSELQKVSKEEAPNLVIKTTNKVNFKVDEYNLLCRKLGLEEKILPKYKFDTPIRPKLKTIIDYEKISKDNKNIFPKSSPSIRNTTIKPKIDSVNVKKEKNIRRMNLSAFDLLGEITNERLITIKEKELNSKKGQDLSQTTILENPHIYSENQIPETKVIIKNRNVKGTKEYILENNPLKIASKDKVENIVVNEKALSDKLKEQSKLINKEDLSAKEVIAPVTHRKELDIKIQNKKNKESKDVKLGFLDNSSMLDEYWEGLTERDKKSNFKKADEKEIEKDAKKYSSFKKPEIFQTSIFEEKDKKEEINSKEKIIQKPKNKSNIKKNSINISKPTPSLKPKKNIIKPKNNNISNPKPIPKKNIKQNNNNNNDFIMSNNNDINKISELNINIDKNKLKKIPYLFSEVQNIKKTNRTVKIPASQTNKVVVKKEQQINENPVIKQNIKNAIDTNSSSYSKAKVKYSQETNNFNNSKLLNQIKENQIEIKKSDNLNQRDYKIIDNKVSELNNKIMLLSKQIENQNQQKGNEVESLKNELRQIVKNLQNEVNKINNDGQRIINMSITEQENKEEMQQKIFDYNHLTLHSIEKFLPEPIKFNPNCKICIKNKNQ